MTEQLVRPIERLAAFNWRYRNDPLGYVRAAFPWNEAGLEGHHGPDGWQARCLGHISERLAVLDGRGGEGRRE